MCTEYCLKVNRYHVSTQGVDERMINVHYCYVTAVKHEALDYQHHGRSEMFSRFPDSFLTQY